MTTTACFIIVSRNDIPIYEAEVGSAAKVLCLFTSFCIFIPYNEILFIPWKPKSMMQDLYMFWSWLYFSSHCKMCQWPIIVLFYNTHMLVCFLAMHEKLLLLVSAFLTALLNAERRCCSAASIHITCSSGYCSRPCMDY